MGLSVREILILDYFDGKPVHAKMPSYLYATYGSDADLCLDRLYADGWIRESTPRETVNMLPDKALSDFLKRYGLSGEGSHTELVRRIIHEVPEKNYNHAVPKVYVLEPKGRTEVGRHMAYVLNVRENYGLTEGEIGESRSALALKGNPCSARDILERAFQQKVSIYTMAGEWSKLRNLYYVMANFHLRAEAGDKALSCLFLVFFLDMSGMGNRNTVIPYENLFPTQKGMILLLDEVRHRENMTAEEVKAAFLSSVARMAPRLPFSYFSREEAGSLKEVPKFTVPKIMAPPSLRMPPAFTRPVPFESTEARKRREEMEKRVVRTVERPTPEEKKEKGLLVKLRKWI